MSCVNFFLLRRRRGNWLVAFLCKKGDRPDSLTIFFMLIAIISRLIPHPPGMTALLAFCFFSGKELTVSKRLLWTCFFSVLTVFLSDLLLACLMKTPIFGGWQLINYSAYFIITMTGFYFQNQRGLLFSWMLLLTMSLFFWLWTNLGVFLMTSIYPFTVSGFLECYWMALPFLKNSVFGDGLWWFLFIFFQPRKQILHIIR